MGANWSLRSPVFSGQTSHENEGTSYITFEDLGYGVCGLVLLAKSCLPLLGTRYNATVESLGNGCGWAVLFILASLLLRGSSRKNIKDPGYGFNDQGELRKLNENGQLTDQPFVFEGQQMYEELGESVTKLIYKFMEEEGELKKVYLKQGSFVFTSARLEGDKLLILINGAGVVRAGQWSRKLIINDGLAYGSQLPYIKRAQGMGYDVVVFNTNDNFSPMGRPIPGSCDPFEHAKSAWEQVVQKSPASQIAIVAHSFGGIVTVDLAKQFLREFENRVFAVMFTDSVHSLRDDDSEVARLLGRVATNYVGSNKETGTPLTSSDAVPMVSAGHREHEWTSWAAFDHIFDSLAEKEEKLRAHL